MKRYIISFKSQEDVKGFLELINSNHVEYSMKNNIVVCTCTEEEINIARNRFGAEIDTLTSPLSE